MRPVADTSSSRGSRSGVGEVVTVAPLATQPTTSQKGAALPHM